MSCCASAAPIAHAPPSAAAARAARPRVLLIAICVLPVRSIVRSDGMINGGSIRLFGRSKRAILDRRPYRFEAGRHESRLAW
ncbi:hypothetical protein D3C83_103070 [compost metagenome]